MSFKVDSRTGRKNSKSYLRVLVSHRQSSAQALWLNSQISNLI